MSGQLYDPFDAALDGAGNVYVATFSSHCINVFTTDGKYLRQFGSYMGLVMANLIALPLLQ